VLEEVLSEVLAFVEMSETVQAHNYHQTKLELCHNHSLQEPQIQPHVMVPPDRMHALKVIEKEIIKIETELKKFQKCSKKIEVSTVPKVYLYELKKKFKKRQTWEK
jgi:hypothetical protein